MSSSQRPLSPHLQVYRPQITTTLSILHRATGIALAVGTLLLTWWLVAAAAGPEAFATAQGFIGSIIGRLLLFGWPFTLFRSEERRVGKRVSVRVELGGRRLNKQKK